MIRLHLVVPDGHIVNWYLEVGSILAMRFVAIFSLLRRRLGRCYRRDAEPHVALEQTQVRERTPFEEKNR